MLRDSYELNPGIVLGWAERGQNFILGGVPAGRADFPLLGEVEGRGPGVIPDVTEISHDDSKEKSSHAIIRVFRRLAKWNLFIRWAYRYGNESSIACKLVQTFPPITHCVWRDTILGSVRYEALYQVPAEAEVS